MSTNITAEAVFDKHVTALGLPKRRDEESLASYAERVGTTDEGVRFLTLAAEAAAVADHADVAACLYQARHHIAPPARAGRGE